MDDVPPTSEPPTPEDDDQGASAILEALREARDASLPWRVLQGLLLPLRSARLLIGTPQLWPLAVAPAVINVAAFGTIAGGMLWYLGTILDWIWPQMEAGAPWYMDVLWYVVAALLVVFILGIAYLAAILIGSILASPFNDVLSERVEPVLSERDSVPERDESLMRSITRAVVSSIAVLGSYAVVMLPIAALNLLQPIGSILSTILGTGVSALFLSLEYADAPLDRRGYDLREKFELIDRHRVLAFGFGLGASLLFWVPLLNVLTIPLAVVGGTALAMVMAEAPTGPGGSSSPYDEGR